MAGWKLKLLESLRGSDAVFVSSSFISSEQVEQQCVHVWSLSDPARHIYCKLKPTGRVTPVEGDAITANYSYGKANGLTNGSPVGMDVVTSLKKVSCIEVEALTDADHEVLTSNAATVQSGLLDQYQLVWKGAVLPLRIGGLRCSIRVVSLKENVECGLLAEMSEVHVLEPKKQVEEPRKTTEIIKDMKLKCTLITPLFIQSKETFPFHCILVSSRTLRNRKLNANFGAIPGFLKVGEKEVLVSLKIDELVPLCHFLVAESLFDGLGLERPTLGEFSACDTMKLKLPKRVLLKHKKEVSRTLLEQGFRKLCVDTPSVFLNHGISVNIGQVTAKVFLDPDTLSYCQLNQGKIHTIPVVFEEEEEERGTEKKSSFSRHVQGLFDDACLKSAILQGLSIDPRLHGTPLESMNGMKHGNILVTGARGMGRTSYVETVCSGLAEKPYCLKKFYINCVRWKGKNPTSICSKLDNLFNSATSESPSCIILDNMELLFSKTEDLAVVNPVEACHIDRVADYLCSLVDGTKCSDVLIVGIAVSKTSIHSLVSTNKGRHFFTHFVELESIDKAKRLDILQSVIPFCPSSGQEARVEELLKRTEGYSVSDLKAVAERSYDFTLQRLSVDDSTDPELARMTCDDLEKSLHGYVPMSLQGIRLVKETTISWKDIGGLRDVKKVLIETLQWPTKYPALFVQIPIRLRSGILLYGPSGTGKTMLASAVARECGVNFISIKGPELLSKYIGSSEQNVRDTFARARAAKPCILFFDEFDSLAPRRGHDSTGVTDRVVNQLLTELDGVEGATKGVWILAASSRPDMIDPALLRPGRIDVSLYCPLPDQADRLEILKILCSKFNLENTEDLPEISSLTDRYSGADLKGLIYDAQLKALTESEDGLIQRAHLFDSLRSSKPSVSSQELQKFEKMHFDFAGGRSVKTKVDQAVTLA